MRSGIPSQGRARRSSCGSSPRRRRVLVPLRPARATGASSSVRVSRNTSQVSQHAGRRVSSAPVVALRRHHRSTHCRSSPAGPAQGDLRAARLITRRAGRAPRPRRCGPKPLALGTCCAAHSSALCSTGAWEAARRPSRGSRAISGRRGRGACASVRVHSSTKKEKNDYKRKTGPWLSRGARRTRPSVRRSRRDGPEAPKDNNSESRHVAIARRRSELETGLPAPLGEHMRTWTRRAPDTAARRACAGA